MIRLSINKREEVRRLKASWKVGVFKADATKVAEEIYSISDCCTPEDLVEKAKDESTELHKCFEWDDTIAGEKYRKIQAQQVLRYLVVTKQPEKQEPVTYRMFVNTGDRSGEYKPTELVVQRKDEYATLLETAKRELIAFRKKYSMLVELKEVFDEIDLI